MPTSNPILPPHVTVGYYTTEGQDTNLGAILTRMDSEYIVILGTAGDPGEDAELGATVAASRLSRREVEEFVAWGRREAEALGATFSSDVDLTDYGE